MQDWGVWPHQIVEKCIILFILDIIILFIIYLNKLCHRFTGKIWYKDLSIAQNNLNLSKI